MLVSWMNTKTWLAEESIIYKGVPTEITVSAFIIETF